MGLNENLKRLVLDYLSAKSGISNTRRAKRIDLLQFLDFLQRHSIEDVKDVSQTIIQLWIESLVNFGYKPSTLARKISTIKHFFKYLALTGSITVNPAESIRAGFWRRERPGYLSDDQISKILQEIQAKLRTKPSFKLIQTYTIFCLMLETGLRAEEVRRIKIGDINEDLSKIKNLRTKGLKFRTVYIPRRLREILSSFLIARDSYLRSKKIQLPNSKLMPLFVNIYRVSAQNPASFGISAKTLYRSIRSLASEFKLHPHKLRHTFAMRLLKSTKDLRLVSQALGHRDVRTTMIYTERTDEEIANAVESLHLPEE